MHRCVHLVLTGILFALACVFADGTDSFTGYASFNWMGQHMTEVHWGWCCGAVAFLGTVTMLSQSWQWRACAAAVLSAAHAGLAAAFLLGNPHAVWSIFCIGYATLGLFLAFSTAYFGWRGKAHLEVFDPPR